MALIDSGGLPVMGTAPMLADGTGAPVLVVANLDPISERGRIDPRAGISVEGGAVTMQGWLESVPGLNQIALEDAFVERHPYCAAQVCALDFSWWRLRYERVCLRDPQRPEAPDHWLDPVDVSGAEPDPLADHETELIDVVSAAFGAATLDVVHHVGGFWAAKSAEIAGIDRYGLRVQITETSLERTVRVPFSYRVDEPEQVHGLLSSLVRATEAALDRRTGRCVGDRSAHTGVALPVGV